MTVRISSLIAALTALLLATLLVATAGAQPASEGAFSGKAKHAILMEAETGAVLYQHAADELAPGLFRISAMPGLRDIPPAPETGDTFEANAIEKALYYSRLTEEAVFADDSGLTVEALGGAPGVTSTGRARRRWSRCCKRYSTNGW